MQDLYNKWINWKNKNVIYIKSGGDYMLYKKKWTLRHFGKIEQDKMSEKIGISPEIGQILKNRDIRKRCGNIHESIFRLSKRPIFNERYAKRCR